MATIFSDGFESGDFTAWTGTSNNPTVETDNPHCNTYNMEAALVASGGSGPIAYETFSSAAIVYARAYIKFTTLNLSSGQLLLVLRLYGGLYGKETVAYVVNSGGTIYWALSVDGNTSVSDATVSTDTYYCVEIKRDVTNDEGELWVDSVSEATDTTNISNNAERVDLGIYYSTAWGANNTVCGDCVEVDTSRVGCESAGVPIACMCHNLRRIHKVIRG